MSTTIWLRAESKPREQRCALTPNLVRELIKKGFRVIVERSNQRIFSDQDFAASGCEIVDAGTWADAPLDAFILGVKDLPKQNTPLSHRHIYFGHAYKGQPGWRDLLARFVTGGGQLLDIEYLVDEYGRRVAAFGYWAGFAGCAVGLKTWVGQQLKSDPVLTALDSYPNKQRLVVELSEELRQAKMATGRAPSIIIIGAHGRVGSGAGDLADALELPVTRWDIEETSSGGPFKEILEHDLFVNCVLVNEHIPPFITKEYIEHHERKLSVVSDVSCDPGPNNPIPIYSECTSFLSPTIRIVEGVRPLDLTAIDHLPSMLPAEASEDFARQLLPHLANLDDIETPVWQRAIDIFNEKTQTLK